MGSNIQVIQKHIGVVLCLVMLVSFQKKAAGQQDPQFSQYMFNPLILNPAYAGSRDVISTVILHRSQWVGFDGAPSTQTLSIHSPLMQKKVGVGLSVLNDHLGPTSVTAFMGSYVYRIRAFKGRIGFGLRTSVYNFRYDWNKIDFKDQDDVYASLGQNVSWKPSFDFGLRYHNRKAYLGLAFSHINRPGISSNDVQDSLGFQSQLIGHYIATGGYAWKLNRSIVLRPTFMYKTAELKTGIIDVSLAALFNQTFWVGITARTNYGFIFITEYNITPKLRVGYSYDWVTNRLQSLQSNSHEVFIGFDIDAFSSKTLNPRYF